MDAEEVAAINIDNETFVERNFTSKEAAYCRAATDPWATFAGW